MSNVVSVPHDQSLPTQPFSDPSLESLRRGYTIVNGRPTKRMIPTAREQAQIRTHIANLKSRLASSATRPELAIELAKLFTAFPTQAQDQVSTNLRMEGYFEALSGLPIWAVRSAREKLLRGETSLDTRFAPTPPQFAVLVRSFTTAVERDLGELERILARVEEPELSDGERNRVRAGFEKLKMDLARRPLSPAE